MMRKKILFVPVAIFPLLNSFVIAQAPLPTELFACRQIPVPGDRLRCYDAAVGRQDRSTPEGTGSPTTPTAASGAASTITISPAEAVSVASKKSPESRTDLQESVSPLSSPQRAAANHSVQSTVTYFSRNHHNKAIVILDNDEIWMETTASKFVGEIKTGSSVTLSREGLGWYRLRIHGSKGVMAVRRIK